MRVSGENMECETLGVIVCLLTRKDTLIHVCLDMFVCMCVGMPII